MIARSGLGILWLVWGIAIVVGFGLLASHTTSAGSEGNNAPPHWPADAPIRRGVNRPMLVVFAHPLCPCTQATLDQLQQLLGEHSKKVDAHVIYFTPSQPPDNWDSQEASARYACVVGATAHWDLDGKLARQFGAKTSGHAYFFDRAGNLRWEGGMTPARGMAGDNDGKRALDDLLSGAKPLVEKTPVFGCEILTED